MKKLSSTPEAILELAKESGVENNYLFTTTFERYQMQLQFLSELKKVIDKSPDMVVKKSYVRGQENLYPNPAVTEYNRTTDSANKTVSTLMRIIRSFGDSSPEEADPLMDILNG